MNTELDFEFVICGGGFKGAITAIVLAKKGRKVCIVETSKKLGGVLNSIPWNGYSLDIGCHLFDNSSSEFTKLMFEIHSEFIPIEVSYMSVIGDAKITKGLAVPDITQLAMDSEMVFDSLKGADDHQCMEPLSDYKDYLIDRFGEYISLPLAECTFKKVGLDPRELCSTASRSIQLDRVKLFDEARSLKFKSTDTYDARLAVSSQHRPMQFYPAAAEFYPHRNFYPAKGGMGEFCRSMERYIEKLGIRVFYEDEVISVYDNKLTLVSETVLTTEQILWTSQASQLEELLYGNTLLKGLSHNVSAVLIYFEVPRSDLADITYLHDFRLDHPAFRISTNGLYSNQHKGEMTYICAEIYTSVNSDYWEISDTNYQPVWAQIRELGIVKRGVPVSTKVIRAPSAYTLPKVGYDKEFVKYLSQMSIDHPRINIDRFNNFSKQSIFEQASQLY